MNINRYTVIGLVGIVYLLMIGDDVVTPVDDDLAPTPSTAMQDKVVKLRQAFSEHEQGKNKAAKHEDFHREWYYVVRDDNGTVFADTAKFQVGYVNALRIVDATEDPQVGCHLNEIMITAMGGTVEDGVDVAPMQGATIEGILEALQAIWWACEQERLGL